MAVEFSAERLALCRWERPDAKAAERIEDGEIHAPGSCGGIGRGGRRRGDAVLAQDEKRDDGEEQRAGQQCQAALAFVVGWSGGGHTRLSV